jgi:hypothetical protein
MSFYDEDTTIHTRTVMISSLLKLNNVFCFCLLIVIEPSRSLRKKKGQITYTEMRFVMKNKSFVLKVCEKCVYVCLLLSFYLLASQEQCVCVCVFIQRERERDKVYVFCIKLQEKF